MLTYYTDNIVYAVFIQFASLFSQITTILPNSDILILGYTTEHSSDLDLGIHAEKVPYV